MNSNSVPAEAISIYNRAFEFSTRGEYTTALEEYHKAIEMYPLFVEAYNNIGEIYSRIGEKDRAISSYMDALKIRKNNRALINLGVEFYNRKNYDRALRYFHESLSLDPEFMEGNFYTGLVYYNHLNFIEAEKHLARVVSVDYRHLKANYILSHIYYEWKEYEKSIQCLDSIRDIADNITFINKYYGFCCYHLGRFNEAVEYLTSALESSPEYERFRDYIKGLTVENKIREVGDINRAISELEEKIMKKDPTIQEASRLSMLYIFNGENQKAEDFLLSVKSRIAS